MDWLHADAFEKALSHQQRGWKPLHQFMCSNTKLLAVLTMLGAGLQRPQSD
jgi:hypothetical protein